MAKIVKIRLDATLQSDLDWSDELQKARSIKDSQRDGQKEAIKKILWHLDLGLFSNLRYPLSHESQFLSLKLSIEHFCEKVMGEFGEVTEGVVLYEGSGLFTDDFRWDDESKLSGQSGGAIHLTTDFDTCLRDHYCANVTADYLDILARYLSQYTQVYIIIDESKIEDPIHRLALLHKERFPHIKLISCHNKAILGEESDLSSIGVLLPSKDKFLPQVYDRYRAVFKKYKIEECRLIPESTLINDWHGLDELVVISDLLEPQGGRKLQGFIAAGGRVIFWDERD